MSKKRKTSLELIETDEQARHYYKQRKKLQDKKLQKNIDRALRNKDYAQLIRMEDN